MSTGTRTPWFKALSIAEDVEQLLRPTTERWLTAGSLRRGRSHVRDLEYVVVPRLAWVPGGDLFGTPQRTNLFLQVLDRLLAKGVIRQAIYSDGTHRWGSKYRGFEYHGIRHEVFSAEHDSFGLHTVIRTGPAAFSKAFVVRLRDQGYEARGGKVYAIGRKLPRSVPDERSVFKLARIPWIEPRDRDHAANRLRQA